MTEIKFRDQDLHALKDKVILITGGSSGIGLATVSMALEYGAKVVMGDLNPPPTNITEHASFTYVPLNVTSWTALSDIFEKAFSQHGRIDHVFANAGIPPRTTLLEDKLDSNGKLQEPDYTVIEVNLKSVLNTTALALHYMRKQRPAGGSIVLTASASSFQRFAAVDYTTAKHGVLGLMRSIVPTLSKSASASSATTQPIRVNAIAPHWTDTGLAPGAVLRASGAICMTPAGPARSALALMADGRYNEALVFSQALVDASGDGADGEGVVYRELDEGLLAATKAMCAGKGPSLDETMEKIVEGKGRRKAGEDKEKEKEKAEVEGLEVNAGGVRKL